MVKIEGLSEREKALREKTSKLVKATEEALGVTGKSRLVVNDLGNPIFYLRHHSTVASDFPITVNAELNRVSVHHLSYFKEACFLAGAYEDITKEEFTIKETYR